MGRNFYLLTYDCKQGQDFIDKLSLIKDQVTYNEYRSAIRNLEDLLEEMKKTDDKRIHLAKRYNDRYVFDHQGWKYFSTHLEFMEWLKSGDIVDEEDHHYDIDEFMQDVARTCADKTVITHPNPLLRQEFSLHHHSNPFLREEFGLSFSDHANFS